LQPTVACEFKRAGFLEGEAIGISLPIGLVSLPVITTRWRWFSQLGSGFACSALQENRPVWIHSLRLAMSQHRDSAVCFAERGEQERIQKGNQRFSVRNGQSTTSGQHHRR
jgi:hypothetical protein